MASSRAQSAQTRAHGQQARLCTVQACCPSKLLPSHTLWLPRSSSGAANSLGWQRAVRTGQPDAQILRLSGAACPTTGPGHPIFPATSQPRSAAALGWREAWGPHRGHSISACPPPTTPVLLTTPSSPSGSTGHGASLAFPQEQPGEAGGPSGAHPSAGGWPSRRGSPRWWGWVWGQGQGPAPLATTAWAPPQLMARPPVPTQRAFSLP